MGRKRIAVCKTEEIAIRIPDAVRSEELLTTIKTRGIQVLAHSCVPAPKGALALVVTDQPQQAKAVLEQKGLECKTNPVVLVSALPHPAVAARLGMELTAAQIGIRYSYATWCEAPQVHVVFKTTDDDQAVRILQTCASI